MVAFFLAEFAADTAAQTGITREINKIANIRRELSVMLQSPPKQFDSYG
jgi:hypothetical protein